MNDNGSGVAAVLETALQLGASPAVPNAVRFAFWGGSKDQLAGSIRYVAGLDRDELNAIALYLNFDELASPNAGYFTLDGDQSGPVSPAIDPDEVPVGSAGLERTLAGYLNLAGKRPADMPLGVASDDSAFLHAGVPIGGTTTGAAQIKSKTQARLWGGDAGVAFDPNYGTAQDNLGAVNRDALAVMGAGVAFAVGTYAASLDGVNGVPPPSNGTVRRWGRSGGCCNGRVRKPLSRRISRMPLANGEVFAGYRILRLLGAGGMGEVYLAQHPRLPRRDALKILPAEMSANREFRDRFNREADLVATLYHPHIIGVHDRGETEGQLWISMDYIDGPDAGRLMRERYPDGIPARHRGRYRLRGGRRVGLRPPARPAAPRYQAGQHPAHRSGGGKSSNTAGGLRHCPQHQREQRPDRDQHRPGHGDLRRSRTADRPTPRRARRPVRAGRHRLRIAIWALRCSRIPTRRSSSAGTSTRRRRRWEPGGRTSRTWTRYWPARWRRTPRIDTAPARISPGRSRTRRLRLRGRPPVAPTRPMPAAPPAPPAAGVPGGSAPLPSRAAGCRGAGLRLGRWPRSCCWSSSRLCCGLGRVARAVSPRYLRRRRLSRPSDRQAVTTTATTTAATTTTSTSAITFDAMHDLALAVYGALPASPMDAWAKFDPHYQNRAGLRDFLGFWSSAQSVSVLSVTPARRHQRGRAAALRHE